jgi:Tol biopolymer transport system component
MNKKTLTNIKIQGLILGFLLLVAACVTSPQQEEPPDLCEGLPQVTDTVTATPAKDPPEVTGKIVFSAPDSTANPQYQLFVMIADGSGLQQLTHGDGSAIQPAWSPDGQTIAYAADSLGSISFRALWLIGADGSDPRPVRYTSGNSFALMGNVPDWHPDGDRLAYDYCIDCEAFGLNFEIYTIELESGNTRKLTEHTAENRIPTWSPDGKRIAFISERDQSEGLDDDLYMMNTNGEDLQRMTCTDPENSPGDYSWLNSDEIIFEVMDRNGDRIDLFILNIESGEMTLLLDDLEVKGSFWMFWDSVHQQLLTITKNPNEPPVTVASYDLNGNLLQQYPLNVSKLKSAKGFDWYIPKE